MKNSNNSNPISKKVTKRVFFFLLKFHLHFYDYLLGFTFNGALVINNITIDAFSNRKL